jgi:hypothetical protein
LKIKQKCLHFDTIEVFEAESQVAPHLYSWDWVDPVPDSLLHRNSGSAENRTRTSGSIARNSDQWHKCWERCICTEGDYFEGDGGQNAQSFWPHGSTSPGNYGWLFAFIMSYWVKHLLSFFNFKAITLYKFLINQF